MFIKLSVSRTNISEVLDINVTKKNKYGYQMYNIGHMIFTFKLDLAIIKINTHAKNENATSRHYSRVIMLIDTMDRQMDASEIITFLSLKVVNRYLLMGQIACISNLRLVIRSS